MGNRVVIQFVHDDNGVSPAIYGHWYGSKAAEMLRGLRAQMSDRPQDIAYVTARAVGRMIGADDDSTGFGLWNAPERLTAEESHGDAGVYVVDISAADWVVTVLGGRTDEQGSHKKAPGISFKRGAS